MSTAMLLWPRTGVLDDEALVELYAPDRSRPRLRMNFVASVDGAVEVDGHAAGLSGPVDRTLLGLLRMHCDALVVGAGTLRQEGYGPLRLDQPRRDWRVARGLTAYPPLVVVSRALALDPQLPALAKAPTRAVVVTSAAAPATQRRALEEVADVIVAGDGDVDLADAVARLHRRGYAQLLCEGGPHLFGALLEAGQVDEVCLTLSPLLAGPGAGRIIAGPRLAKPAGLSLAHLAVADEMLLLRYASDGITKSGGSDSSS
jgi:riboflavin biosynthesis pyrimidine reductase